MPVSRAPPRRRRAALAIASVAAALFAAAASCQNRDALREIVQDQCLPHWREQQNPAPCVELHLDAAARTDSGFAVLADRKGGAHFLLIPIRTISGIESPALEAPDAPSYFQAAWRSHERLDGVIGRPVPPRFVGLAVNPTHARGQDQLHIHIECLRQDVHETLARQAAHISSSWSPVTLGGASYWVRSISEHLDADDPFKLLASYPPEPGRGMTDYTLVVTGAPAEDAGFLMLASSSAAGELLLDSTCAAVQAAP
jgi:CDP-diacylglycerol pyrophosphatase